MAGAVGAPGLCKLIDGLGGAFGLILAMTGSCALLLLVSVLSSVGGGDAMMEALGKWLLSVSAAALLVSVVQTLIPEGGMRRVASFTGGLLLLAVLLRPVLGADFSGLSAGLDRWTEQVEQRQSELANYLPPMDLVALPCPLDRAGPNPRPGGSGDPGAYDCHVPIGSGRKRGRPLMGLDQGWVTGGGGDKGGRRRHSRSVFRRHPRSLVGGPLGVHCPGPGHPGGAADMEGTGQ